MSAARIADGARYERRAYGRTGLNVPAICVGTSSWAGPSDSGPERDRRIDELARAMVESGLNFIDTSNIYGAGESESMIGVAYARGSLSRDVTLQTKLDRDTTTNDFSAARMWRSLDESLTRLGVGSVPVLFLHDPENTTFDYAMSAGGPVEALIEMKRQGLAGHIGISGGPTDLLTRFVDEGVFDALITHNRYTLLDRSAAPLIENARVRGMAVTNAAPYGGGILTGDPRFADRYAYAPAHPAVIESARLMARECEKFGVSLGAAALQFSARNPGVHSTVVGISTAARLSETCAYLDEAIDPELWSRLEQLVPVQSTWLEPPESSAESRSSKAPEKS